MESGHLVFHDHESIKAEEVLCALGGEECRCLEVLRLWRSISELREQAIYQWRNPTVMEIKNRLPASLREPFIAAYKRGNKRMRAKRSNPCKDNLTLSLGERGMQRVNNLVELVSGELQRCTRYGLSGDRRNRRHYQTDTITIGNNGYRAMMKSRSGEAWVKQKGRSVGPNMSFDVVLPFRWYRNIYKRNLAVVDGYFITDVINETSNKITVLAGRQVGDNVYPAEAVIENNRLRFV